MLQKYIKKNIDPQEKPYQTRKTASAFQRAFTNSEPLGFNMTEILGPEFTIITKTRLFKYIENFSTKNRKFSDKKKSDIFHISAQSIDCGYSLEPPHRGGSNEYPQSMFLSRNMK